MGLDLTGLGSVADFADTLVKRFLPEKMSEAEKAQAQIGMRQMIQGRENTLMDAQKSVLVAELQQGDAYTKRARPTVVYLGLLFIFMVHVAFPMITFWTSETAPDLKLPQEFWWAWTGICSTWVIGRSFEKQGVKNKVVGLITGNK